MEHRLWSTASVLVGHRLSCSKICGRRFNPVVLIYGLMGNSAVEVPVGAVVELRRQDPNH